MKKSNNSILSKKNLVITNVSYTTFYIIKALIKKRRLLSATFLQLFIYFTVEQNSVSQGQ